MGDNLVKRLRQPAFGTETTERNLMAKAADSIEELEAENKRLRLEAAHANDTADAAIECTKEIESKFRKCMGALGDISKGEPEWPDDPQRELDWCRNRAASALAELKGTGNE